MSSPSDVGPVLTDLRTAPSGLPERLVPANERTRTELLLLVLRGSEAEVAREGEVVRERRADGRVLV
jgi:hypothetical protein